MRESKKIIYLYTAFQFFYSLLIWVPVFYEYQKQSGLNDLEIFRIQTLYYIVFCFLEIPTGYLADRIGYKKCLILGSLTLICANFFPIYSQNYAGFLWHFLLLALSRSFISGASSAYLYEFLQESNSQHEYAQIEGKARALSLIGKVFCWAIVGLLMKWHFTLPYWITVFNAALSLFFALSLPQISSQKLIPKNSLKKTFQTLKDIRHDFYLIFLIFQGIGIFTLTRLCQVNLYQPILDSKNFSLFSFGWIMSLMTLSEALGSYYPQHVQRFFSDRRIVSITTLLLGTTLFLIPFSEKSGTIFLLLLFSLAAGVSYPIQKQLIQDALQGKNQFRATLLSFESIIDRGACAWMAALVGDYLEQKRLNLLLMKAGLLSILVIILLSFCFYVIKKINLQKNKLNLDFNKEGFL
jgi:MFS family permease